MLETLRDNENFDSLWEKCQVLQQKAKQFVEENKFDVEVKEAKISQRWCKIFLLSYKLLQTIGQDFSWIKISVQ